MIQRTTDVGRWVVESWRGNAGLVHGRALPVDGLRRISVVEMTAPAIVLGSAQKAQVDLDAAAERGVAVVRRRSGGGAVWVDVATGWIEVFVPRGDVLWADDIGVSFGWLGETFAEVLVEVGIEQTRIEISKPPFEAGRLGSLVCFAGRGPGEILVDGRKLIGMSQRRVRAGARFQCCWYRHWDPRVFDGLLADPVLKISGLAMAGIGLAELGLEPAAVSRRLLAAVAAR